MEPEKDEHFEVELFDPTGGAKLGSISRMAVTITNDDGAIPRDIMFDVIKNNFLQPTTASPTI